MTRPTTVLRGMALADAVRMFERHGVPMVVKPMAENQTVPPGWLPVLMATPKPKHKSASTIRRDQGRQGWRVKKAEADARRQEGATT